MGRIMTSGGKTYKDEPGYEILTLKVQGRVETSSGTNNTIKVDWDDSGSWTNINTMVCPALADPADATSAKNDRKNEDYFKTITTPRWGPMPNAEAWGRIVLDHDSPDPNGRNDRYNNRFYIKQVLWDSS
jgi:hypothetical protein